MTRHIKIANHAICASGRVPRIWRLRDEYYDQLVSPRAFVQTLKSRNQVSCDLFTFLQPVADCIPRYPYHLVFDSAAVLPLSTYEHWWKRQINDKTRNMVRKAGKAGVKIREEEFSDNLVDGIVGIYNECPFRQGRRFRHYGKSAEIVKDEHASFLDRSDFFGAYYNEKLIGFIKLVHGDGVSNLMQIISMVSHRDKAPTNSLLATAVERCTARGIPLLHYGTWSRRSMGDFKKHHAFMRVEVPRYYVPFTSFGEIALRLGLHRSLVERLPEAWLDHLATWRTKWNYFRHAEGRSKAGVPRSVSPLTS